MGELDGRMAIITGAGRGIGREHALLFAREGASVVVNDLGGTNDGSGSDSGPAREVVGEIRAGGGNAVANTDVADWDGAAALVEQAVTEFGRLDVLVNNAGGRGRARPVQPGRYLAAGGLPGHGEVPGNRKLFAVQGGSISLLKAAHGAHHGDRHALDHR